LILPFFLSPLFVFHFGQTRSWTRASFPFLCSFSNIGMTYSPTSQLDICDLSMSNCTLFGPPVLVIFPYSLSPWKTPLCVLLSFFWHPPLHPPKWFPLLTMLTCHGFRMQGTCPVSLPPFSPYSWLLISILLVLLFFSSCHPDGIDS